MSKSHCLWLSCLAAVAAGLFLALPACEDEKSTDALDRFFADHPYISDPRKDSTRRLRIEPDVGTVSFIGEEIAFRVFGGQTPYEWNVAVGPAGGIENQRDEGSSSHAIYKARAVQENTVIVNDANGWAAVAPIVVAGAEALSITPTTATASNAVGTTFLFIATGGVGDYTWSVFSTDLGTITDLGGSQGEYLVVEAGGLKGENLIYVEDEAGDVVSATITHQ